MKNVILDYLMVILTELGSASFAFVVGVICLFFKKKETKLMGIFLLAATYISINLTGFLKNLFMIPRPFLVLEGVNYFIGASGYSFPSGHTSIAFMVATILSIHFRQKSLLYLLAVIVAFSRIYLGVHYPSDVLAGAVLGLLIGCSFVFFYRSIIGDTLNLGKF